jgi:hypothetical protein
MRIPSIAGSLTSTTTDSALIIHNFIQHGIVYYVRWLLVEIVREIYTGVHSEILAYTTKIYV